MAKTGGTMTAAPRDRKPRAARASLHERLRAALAPDEIARCYRGLIMACKAADPKKPGEEVPDHAVRLAALKDYMDRAHGRCGAREAEAPAGPAFGLEDLEAEAGRSPSFRSGLTDLLQRLLRPGVAG